MDKISKKVQSLLSHTSHFSTVLRKTKTQLLSIIAQLHIDLFRFVLSTPLRVCKDISRTARKQNYT